MLLWNLKCKHKLFTVLWLVWVLNHSLSSDKHLKCFNKHFAACLNCIFEIRMASVHGKTWYVLVTKLAMFSHPCSEGTFSLVLSGWCKWPMTVILHVIAKCNFHIKFENIENQCWDIKSSAAVSWYQTVGHSRGYFDHLPFYTFCMLIWEGSCIISRGSCSAEQHLNRKHEILVPPERCVGWDFPLLHQPESWWVRDCWTVAMSSL